MDVTDLRVGGLVKMGQSEFRVLQVGAVGGQSSATPTSVLLECTRAAAGSGWEASIRVVGVARVWCQAREIDSILEGEL